MDGLIWEKSNSLLLWQVMELNDGARLKHGSMQHLHDAIFRILFIAFTTNTNLDCRP